MVQVIIQIIIALIVAGFIYWALSLLINALPLPAIIKAIAEICIVILAVAIVIFGAIIPLLHFLGGLTIPGLH